MNIEKLIKNGWKECAKNERFDQFDRLFIKKFKHPLNNIISDEIQLELRMWNPLNNGKVSVPEGWELFGTIDNIRITMDINETILAESIRDMMRMFKATY